MKTIILVTLIAIYLISARAQPVQVFPVRADGFTQSLKGDWSFKYLPALDAGADADFSKPAFDVSAWKTIPVPANWEMKGFAEPRYDTKLADGLGLYRRTFRVPATWRGGRRVCLRFEGVAFGFEAWVNGTKVGVSGASAFNPNTFDITDALQAEPNADNVLAVQVTTKPFAWEFDVNDDWSLSGIYRDVTLFSVPKTFVQDVSTHTKLAADGTADLSVVVKLNQESGKVRGILIAPGGKTAGEFELSPTTNGQHSATVHVTQPQLWTAETPALYRLQLTLSANGQPLQTIEERVGLREISIKDGVLLLNGRPIKMRGVCHHDLDPVDGRAITEAEMRHDLELMKKGNINHIRTSHYPPQPRFLELCDEMGFYVMDEVALGSRGGKHLKDPAYRDNILARTEAAVTRDKNHASVIVWSIGNENPFENIELDAVRYAKELDPTRPVCIPQTPDTFAKSWQRFPEFVDIYSPHYPTDSELREQAKTLKRPTIYSEYVHAWGLGLDRLAEQWEVMQATPQLTGGAIWHFQDQGILRTAGKPVANFDNSLGAVWLDKNRFYDTHDADGCDGIVYADRTPQTDFWETRKVYSPVQIAERNAVVKLGAQEISLTVENRHDFRALAGMKLAWSLQRNGAEVQQGEAPLHAAAHEKETAHIAVNIPADANDDVLALNVRCLDENNLQITERAVRLDLADAKRDAWLNCLAAVEPKVTETEAEVNITLPQWSLTVDRATGALSIRDRVGRVLVAGIFPHSGRKFTMIDERNATGSRRAKGTDIWPTSTLTNLTAPEIKVTKQNSSVILSVAGRYPRSGTNEQSLVGGYQAEIKPNGTIAISYNYKYDYKYEIEPSKNKSIVLEAGLSVVVPDSLSEFRWIGQGPYPAYPGKEQLDEFGLFHLNREDLYFQGNRRETELALLTTPSGAGIALATAAADVAVERDANKTRLSQNALLSGLGNKAWLPETVVDLTKTPRIAGSFTLVLLEETWPTALTRWFGKPSAAQNVFRPFYHSYDQ